MRPLRAALLATALVAVPALAHAGKFGGFSADGTRYLDGKDQVCTPAVVDAGGVVTTPEACEAVTDKKALKAFKFAAPKKVAKKDAGGWLALAVVADGVQVRLEAKIGEDTRVLASRELAHPVTAVRGPWLAADGRTLALEADVGEGKAKVTHTLAFEVGAGLEAMRPKPGGLVDRVVSVATTWVQAQVACEQAGVTLELGPGSAARFATDVKCQGMRDRLRVSGDFWGEEPDTLVFRFVNEDAPEERLTCQVTTCEGEMCIGCASGDVTFTLLPKAQAKPAKKKPGLTR
jgi:hypothetical protein